MIRRIAGNLVFRQSERLSTFRYALVPLKQFEELRKSFFKYFEKHTNFNKYNKYNQNIYDFQFPALLRA